MMEDLTVMEEELYLYELVDCKPVKDHDGFWTYYSWFRRDDGLNVFTFDDEPEEGCYDWDEDDDDAAESWFEYYPEDLTTEE